MDFELGPEQQLLRQTVRDFARDFIAPRSQAWDEGGRFPDELVPAMRSLGLWGLSIPEEYGGAGADHLAFSLVTMELSRHDGNAGMIFFLHNGISTRSLVTFGSEEQKRAILPALATAERLAAWGMTEPHAGSDATAMRTTAVRDGDDYVLNGVKVFCSLGGVAEVYIIQAKTDPHGRGDGISFFIVERNSPGFRLGREEKKLGMRAVPLRELIFDDCRIPRQNLLLEAPSAFRKMMNLFNTERLGNSSCSVGIADGAWAMASTYAEQRNAFGVPLVDFQGLRWMLTDMAIQLECARMLIYQTAFRIDRDLPVIREASMMKIFANETAQKVVNDALQIFGAAGYMREAGVEQKLRDVRGLAIAGGTPQVLRNTLANQLLGRSKDGGERTKH